MNSNALELIGSFTNEKMFKNIEILPLDESIYISNTGLVKQKNIIDSSTYIKFFECEKKKIHQYLTYMIL